MNPDVISKPKEEDMARIVPDLETARAIVCDYLHWNGSCYGILSDADATRIFCMGDGFGAIGEAVLAINSGWDWSHIRDSSPDAFFAMAEEITRIVNGTRA